MKNRNYVSVHGTHTSLQWGGVWSSEETLAFRSYHGQIIGCQREWSMRNHNAAGRSLCIHRDLIYFSLVSCTFCLHLRASPPKPLPDSRTKPGQQTLKVRSWEASQAISPAMGCELRASVRVQEVVSCILPGQKAEIQGANLPECDKDPLSLVGTSPARPLQ